jgi:CBS domain-containing protein
VTTFDDRERSTLAAPWWIRTDAEGYQPIAGQHTKEVVMTTARDIMTGGVECIGENENLEDAARKMRDLDVGSLPICGEDNRLKGMLTDRDIVTKCVADGRDVRATRAGEFAQGKPVTVGADDPVEEILRMMKQHKVRRLPVIDGQDLVGIVSQGDVARNIDETKVGELVETISS